MKEDVKIGLFITGVVGSIIAVAIATFLHYYTIHQLEAVVLIFLFLAGVMYWLATANTCPYDPSKLEKTIKELRTELTQVKIAAEEERKEFEQLLLEKEAEFEEERKRERERQQIFKSGVEHGRKKEKEYSRRYASAPKIDPFWNCPNCECFFDKDGVIPSPKYPSPRRGNRK